MQNKRHDHVHLFQLEDDGIFVREYRLRGTKVFGNTKAKKLELFVDEDSECDSEEDFGNAGAGDADETMNRTGIYEDD